MKPTDEQLNIKCAEILRIDLTGKSGHTWRLTEWGEIDNFGLDYGYHNGPICTVCGSFILSSLPRGTSCERV